MLVKDFMQENVITVSSQDSIYEALKILKDRNFRRMPVVDNGKLVGIVTRKAIREASPSKATTLSVHELNYILSKMTVADVMKKKVMTITKDTPIEEAGFIMHKYQIGALPVIEDEKMVGYISSNDMFTAIVRINGLDRPVTRITLEIHPDDWQQTIVTCTEIIQEVDGNFKMMSLMGTTEADKKKLIFRFIDDGKLDRIVERMKAKNLNVVSVFQNIKLV